MGAPATGTFELKVGEGDSAAVGAYLKLPTYPADGLYLVSRTVRLADCIGDYEGPDLAFDFDEAGVLVGIHILT